PVRRSPAAARSARRPVQRSLAAPAGSAQAGSGAVGAEGSDQALRLAGHLAELAWLAAPRDAGIARIRHEVFTARADAATSTMATGVFSWAATESLKER